MLKESREYVVTWFPPDKPVRHVGRRTLQAAHDYIAEEELEHYAPMIEEVHLVIEETRRLVWNSIK